MFVSACLDRRSFQYFCVFFPLALVLFFFVVGQELPELKYLAVMLCGIGVFSILLAYVVSLNFEAYVVCFVVFTPLLVWVNSVLFISGDDYFMSLSSFVLLLGLPLTFLVSWRFYCEGKLVDRDNVYYVYLLWAVMFVVLTVVFVSVEEYSFVLYFLDEFSIFILMTNLVLLRVGVSNKDDWRDLLLLMMKYLLFVSFLIIVIEVMTRSNGNPLNFLSGARRLYSGTSGDVTGGFGEPVTMGLFGSVMFIVALRQRLGKMILLFSAFLVVFSVGRSPMLVLVLTVFFYVVFQASAGKRFLLIPVVCVGFYLAYLIYLQRLGDVNDLRYVGGIAVDYNMYLYLNNISGQLAGTFFEDYGIFLKFLMFPLLGGVASNQFFALGLWFVPVMKGGVLCLSFIIISRGKELWFKASVCCVFAMIFYYGAFSSTAYSFFYVSEQPVFLGYVPRETPLYFFVYALFLFSLCSRKLCGVSR